MRWAASSLTPLLVFLVIAFTQSAHGKLEPQQRDHVAETVAAAEPLAVQVAVKEITPTTTEMNVTVSSNVTADDAMLLGAEAAVIAALAESDSLTNITKVMREQKIIGDRMQSPFARALLAEVEAKKFNMSEPEIQNATFTMIDAWHKHEEGGGDAQCNLLESAFNAAAAAIQPELALQEAANEMHKACSNAFISHGHPMINAGQAMLVVANSLADPANPNAMATGAIRTLTPDETKQLEATVKAGLMSYLVAVAAEKQKELDEQREEAARLNVRLQKRFIRTVDQKIHAFTERKPMKEAARYVRKYGMWVVRALGFKLWFAVVRGDVKEMAGLRYLNSIRDNAFPGPDKPDVLTLDYDELAQLTAAGRAARFRQADGLYHIKGVPARSRWGGGLDKSLFPDAVPLDPGMCKYLSEYQSWRVGVTIHPLSAHTPNWCRGVLIQYMEKGRPRPIPNLELSRHSVSQLVAIVKELIGVGRLRIFGTIVMTLLSIVAAYVFGWGLAANSLQSIMLAIFKDPLVNGGSYLMQRVLGYAQNRAIGEATKNLPAPIKMLNRFNVLASFRNWRRGSSATDAAAFEVPEATLKTEDDVVHPAPEAEKMDFTDGELADLIVEAEAEEGAEDDFEGDFEDDEEAYDGLYDDEDDLDVVPAQPYYATPSAQPWRRPVVRTIHDDADEEQYNWSGVGRTLRGDYIHPAERAQMPSVADSMSRSSAFNGAGYTLNGDYIPAQSHKMPAQYSSPSDFADNFDYAYAAGPARGHAMRA